MARNRDRVFDEMANVPRRNAVPNQRVGRPGIRPGQDAGRPGIRPGQDVRGPYDPDRKPGPGPVPPVPGGVQQWGPGTQSSLSSWIDFTGGGGGTGGDSSFDSWFDYQGITNMSDFYDWWEAGGWPGSAQNYDSFYDWLTQGWPSTGGQLGTILYGGTGGQPGYGGGAQGGPGDLGTGNVFIGGGMGSAAHNFDSDYWEAYGYEGGLQGQDCASLGPQFNSAGECISCCESQYAGTGFYGDPGYEPGTGGGGVVDPEMGTDCWDQYVAMQGAGGDMSFDDFSGLYC